jgi:hypothetical protein
LTKVDEKRLKVSFQGAPPFIHGLEQSPAEREPMLSKGTWLVMAYGFFSSNDVACIDPAVQRVMNLVDKGHPIQLGVRPFGQYEEQRTWLGAEYNYESPFWVVYRDGNVLGTANGLFFEGSEPFSVFMLQWWVESVLAGEIVTRDVP